MDSDSNFIQTNVISYYPSGEKQYEYLAYSYLDCNNQNLCSMNDGIQHNKAAIVNNGTDTVWGAPSMDGFGAYSVCSASGHWA